MEHAHDAVVLRKKFQIDNAIEINNMDEQDFVKSHAFQMDILYC